MPGGLEEQEEPRLFDYFCSVGRGRPTGPDDGKPITERQFDGQILDRYPAVDHSDYPLPLGITAFCFPAGVRLHEEPSLPECSFFVLTNDIGTKLYCASLLFYEILHPMEAASISVRCTTKSGHITSSPSSSSSPSAAAAKSRLKSGAAAAAAAPVGGAPEAMGMFTPKCLVIMSHYPYFLRMKQLVAQVYRIAQSSPPIPIERYIANVMSDVPLPPLGKMRVECTVGDRVFSFSRPAPNALPLLDLPMSTLLQHLDVNNLLLAFSAVATENKVVFTSSSMALLTMAQELFQALLFPLYWVCIYVPLLPKALLDYCSAPVPVMLGVHSSFLEYAKVAMEDDTVIIDLDNNNVIVPDGAVVPRLPLKPADKLKSSLKKAMPHFSSGPKPPHSAVHGRVDTTEITTFAEDGGFSTSLRRSVSNNLHHQSHSPTSPADQTAAGCDDSSSSSKEYERTYAIRKAFFRLFTAVLKDYAHYLSPDPNAEDRFDRASFLHDAPESSRPFLAAFTSTQMFQGFLDDRVTAMQALDTISMSSQSTTSSAAQQHNDIQFFDESVAAKVNRSVLSKKAVTPFLDSRAWDLKETFHAPLPYTLGLPSKAGTDSGDTPYYQYESFPRLVAELFGPSNVGKRSPCLVEGHERVHKTPRLHAISNAAMMNSLAGRLETRTWKAMSSAVVRVQCHWRRLVARRRFRLLRSTTKRTQRLWRNASGFRHRVALENDQRAVALLKLQAHFRGAAVRYNIRQQQNSAKFLQSWVRMRPVRQAFLNERASARRIQALWRGALTRMRSRQSFHVRRLKCFPVLLKYWVQHFVPLQRRINFMSMFSCDEFLDLRAFELTVDQLKALPFPAAASMKANKAALKAEGAKIYAALKKQVDDQQRNEWFAYIGLQLNAKRKKEKLCAFVATPEWWPQGPPVEELLAIDRNIDTAQNSVDFSIEVARTTLHPDITTTAGSGGGAHEASVNNSSGSTSEVFGTLRAVGALRNLKASKQDPTAQAMSRAMNQFRVGMESTSALSPSESAAVVVKRTLMGLHMKSVSVASVCALDKAQKSLKVMKAHSLTLQKNVNELQTQMNSFLANKASRSRRSRRPSNDAGYMSDCGSVVSRSASRSAFAGSVFGGSTRSRASSVSSSRARPQEAPSRPASQASQRPAVHATASHGRPLRASKPPSHRSGGVGDKPPTFSQTFSQTTFDKPPTKYPTTSATYGGGGNLQKRPPVFPAASHAAGVLKPAPKLGPLAATASASTGIGATSGMTLLPVQPQPLSTAVMQQCHPDYYSATPQSGLSTPGVSPKNSAPSTPNSDLRPTTPPPPQPVMLLSQVELVQGRPAESKPPRSPRNGLPPRLRTKPANPETPQRQIIFPDGR